MWKNGRYLLVLLILLSSCIIVKVRVPDEEFSKEFTLLPKTSIPISDESIRSDKGDMIAFLPVGWQLIDTENKEPSNIFAIAVNPEYTLSIVFSKLTNKFDVAQTLKTEGLLGVAMKCFENKKIKSLNNIRLLGDYEPLKNGLNKFYVFKYENLSNKLVGKSAIFVTPLSEVYEFSLIELDIKEKPNISESDFDKLFFSILNTIRY